VFIGVQAAQRHKKSRRMEIQKRFRCNNYQTNCEYNTRDPKQNWIVVSRIISQLCSDHTRPISKVNQWFHYAYKSWQQCIPDKVRPSKKHWKSLPKSPERLRQWTNVAFRTSQRPNKMFDSEHW